jgi:leader peptidase (prepilin peptidase)/N-methyltransferase
VRPWLAVRCRHCGGSLGTPVTLELATAAVLALLVGKFGGQPDMVAFAFLGALGVALSAIDIAVQRLPDRLTLPAFPVLIALLAGSAAIQHDAGALARALLGGAALTICYLLLALPRSGQLGGGDIKLAGLAGLVLGWLAGLAYPARRGSARFPALRRGHPGTAGRAADYPAQRDLLRAVPARRHPARDPRQRQ